MGQNIVKTKFTLIKNQMMSESFLDDYKRIYPKCYVHLLKLDYGQGLELIKLLPENQKAVCAQQLRNAYEKALKYYGLT